MPPVSLKEKTNMAKGKKVCKVCGQEYEACHTLRPNLNSEFRWQDVACCPEHGQEYLRRVLSARGKLNAESVQEEVPAQEEKPAPVKRTRKKRKPAQAAEE